MGGQALWGESVRERTPAHNPNKQTNKAAAEVDGDQDFDNKNIQ